jgi:hypothetical protein
MIRVTRCVREKVAQNVAQSICCENECTIFIVKKVAQLFVLFLQFSQKLPKLNSRPIGENSPNLVTLCMIPNFWATFSTVKDVYYI